MRAEVPYEVRVKVKTLADVSKIIHILDDAGYRDVEMGPPRPMLPFAAMARAAGVVRGRFNKVILKALQELGATSKEHASSAEEIIEHLRKNPEFAGLLECAPPGILIRTVNMIASATLADRHEMVSYDEEQVPRRFWLTRKGLERSRE